MEKVINWFRKKNTNYTFVAGGSWKRWDGWDWGKILGIIALILALLNLFI